MLCGPQLCFHNVERRRVHNPVEHINVGGEKKPKVKSSVYNCGNFSGVVFFRYALNE